MTNIDKSQLINFRLSNYIICIMIVLVNSNCDINLDI